MMTSSVCFSQRLTTDKRYIGRFEENNVAELFVGNYSTYFNFTEPDAGLVQKSDFKLSANTSAYMGFYVNYKWLSITYSTALPGTRLDNETKLQLTSFSIPLGNRRMRFRPYYSNYNGMLIAKEERGNYEPFQGIRFVNVGMDYFYFANSAKFSYSAASAFSEQQKRSAGAFFFKAAPVWQKIQWQAPSRMVIKDTATFILLASNPEWVSLSVGMGYSYNFSIKQGKWLIAPALMLGGGMLKELNSPKKRLQPVSTVQAWINAGYCGDKYYGYLNARWSDLKTNLDIKNIDRINNDISITGGFRFGNAKKKFLKIL